MASLWLTSRLLPVPHGFSTRAGGVSQGAFASLNLSDAVGDDPRCVAENLARLLAEAGVDGLVTARQVHGDRVATAAEALAGGCEADVVVGDAPPLAVAVRTADCVPVLLVDPEHRQVAAVHSGWRGTELEVAARGVDALVRRGARAARLLAAVGPAIQVCCYEVSEALAARFAAQFGPEVAMREGSKPHLNLSAAVQKTLIQAGLKPEHVDVLQDCTCCDAGRFFSHRRDAGHTGRHLNWVVPTQPSLHLRTP